MPAHIPESDWRHFKKVHQQSLERFSRRTLEQLEAIIQANDGTAHDRYLRAFKLLIRRNEDMARAFDDFRRSTAVMQLGIMHGMGLLSDDDLKHFSEETQTRVRGIESIFRPKPGVGDNAS